MIIDRPTLATRNGLGNAIRGWPRWMLCQAFKKHKLCSSWRVKKPIQWEWTSPLTYPYFLASHLNSVRLRNLETSVLFVCSATPVPWRRVKKAYSVGIDKSAAACCTCFSLVIILHITYPYFLVSHLQLCPIEDFGKPPYSLSAVLHLCRDAGSKKPFQWELTSLLLLAACASAWSSYST